MNDQELIQYFLVNKDLKMKAGKIAAQVAHAATIHTAYMVDRARREIDRSIETPEMKDYKYWYNTIMKKVVLKAPQELLEELEKEGYISIRDAGYTQIPENSLTVVTLGVTTREKVEHIVKDLSLL